jgi:hypothetical protein
MEQLDAVQRSNAEREAKPRVHATATLHHLALRDRLMVHELVPGEDRERVAEFLRLLLAHPEGIDVARAPASWLPQLSQRFVVTRDEPTVESAHLPFRSVTALNFELTYACNLACSHCLQEGLRPSGKTPWLGFELIAQALADARWLDLVEAVNFTGGEVCQPASPVLDAIALAARYGLRVRCNTNGWWGARRGFSVGATRFDSEAQLVSHLRSIGLTTLALSLDNRYAQYPELLERVLAVAARCEEVGLRYELVTTDAPPALVAAALDRLNVRLGREPAHLNDSRRKRPREPGSKDATDIGAAAGPAERALDVARLAALVPQAPCKKKGFYRPAYLHVNPDGGVRSCLLAPGAGPFGSLRDERLPQLLNRAARSPVVRLFARGSIDELVAQHIAPFRHLYRGIDHPCAASALVARVCEALARRGAELGRPLDHSEEEVVHEGIARDWNLGASPRSNDDGSALYTLSHKLER